MNELRKNFRAPWDFTLITVTSFVVVGLLALNFYTQSLVPTIFTFGIIIITAAFGVYGYKIEDKTLVILRLGWSKRFQLSDIKSIDYKPIAMAYSIRTWGIGGVFGYIGYFKNRTLSNYKAYATHRRKTVVIVLKNKSQIVVTPDNPEEFVESLKASL